MELTEWAQASESGSGAGGNICSVLSGENKTKQNRIRIQLKVGALRPMGPKLLKQAKVENDEVWWRWMWIITFKDMCHRSFDRKYLKKTDRCHITDTSQAAQEMISLRLNNRTKKKKPAIDLNLLYHTSDVRRFVLCAARLIFHHQTRSRRLS